MKLSVIIPAYNEEQNIKRGVLNEVSSYLQKKSYLWEVIIVDDGSTDRTAELVGDFVKKHRVFSLVKITHSGKGAAIIAGFKKAKGEILLFCDFDQSVPIKEIEKFLPPSPGRSRQASPSRWPASPRGEPNGLLEGGKYDVVIGSRTSRQGAPVIRKITGYGFILLQKLLLGLPYKDTQCGFKALTREAAQAIIDALPKSSRLSASNSKGRIGYAPNAGFDIELLLVAKKLGLKVVEIPVLWRHKEKSTFNVLKVSYLALIDIINIRIFRH